MTRPQTVSVLPERIIICHVLDFSRPTFIREADGRTTRLVADGSSTARPCMITSRIRSRSNH